MPPSRELTVEVREEELARIYDDLNLSGPVGIRIRKERQNRLYGLYQNATRRVTLYIGNDIFEKSRLTGVHTEILATLLHELRHAHQHDNWPAEKVRQGETKMVGSNLVHWNPDMEADAERYAEENVHRYRSLITIKPKYAVSNLRRLAAAERSLAR